jgi:hypothetical protein
MSPFLVTSAASWPASSAPVPAGCAGSTMFWAPLTGEAVAYSLARNS